MKITSKNYNHRINCTLPIDNDIQFQPALWHETILQYDVTIKYTENAMNVLYEAHYHFTLHALKLVNKKLWQEGSDSNKV